MFSNVQSPTALYRSKKPLVWR